MSNEPNDAAADSGIVKSADRVLDLFELLGSWGNEMSHSEIALALKIPKGSLSKLLKNLVARQYVEYQTASKGYRLGEALGRLASISQQVRTLVSYAEPLLKEITDKTRESCALSQLRVDQVEVVASVSSPQRLVSHMRTGDLAPLYAVSGGKAILAHLPHAMCLEYLASVTFESYTTHTLESPDELLEQLDAIRKSGVGYSIEEFTPGVVGIATPILSETGYPLGALNIAMPAVRFTQASKQAAVDALTAAADTLRRQYLNGRSE